MDDQGYCQGWFGDTYSKNLVYLTQLWPPVWNMEELNTDIFLQLQKCFWSNQRLKIYHPDPRRKIHQHHHIIIDCPLLYMCKCSCPQSHRTFFAPSWDITLIKRLSWQILFMGLLYVRMVVRMRPYIHVLFTYHLMSGWLFWLDPLVKIRGSLQISCWFWSLRARFT